MNRDLTVGKPFSVLWRFVLPMLFSMLFQQIYNLADTMIAGRFLGEHALSAIGASFPVTMLFMQVANGLNAGVAVVISQTFGAKKFVHLKSSFTTAMITVSVVSIILTAGGLIFARSIMEALQTPPDLVNDSLVYLNIYYYGMFFLFIYNACNGVFTALGDSKTPLAFLIFSSCLNIVLDLLFVTVIDFGIAGIAWATFAAQGLAAVLSFIMLMRRIHKMNLTKRHKIPKFNVRMLQKLTFIAVPSILQSSFVSVGNIFVQAVINSFGAASIAGFAVGMKVSIVAVNAMGTAANGISAFTAQNIGAHKPERVAKGFKSGLLLSWIFIIPFLVFFIFTPNGVINLFMESPGTSADAVAIGAGFINFLVPFYPILAIKLACDCVLRGAGAMKTFMAATFLDLALRVALTYILSPTMGLSALYVAWATGWTLAACFSYFVYKQGHWKRHMI
jgi:putative MATE family efflux protein